MVEILKRDAPPTEKQYTVTCFSCKSKLRFLRSEAKYVYNLRDGDALKIECPVCLEPLYTRVGMTDA